jgi:hypothetical protein
MLEKITGYSTLAIAITGVLALVFAYDQIRESHDQAQIQHLIELVNQFDQKPFTDLRTKLALSRIDRKHEALVPLKPDDAPDEMYTILDFFDHVGLLEQRGYLDKSDVWAEFSSYLFPFYADAQPVIYEEQKATPATWQNVALLMKDLQDVDARKENSISSNQTTQDDLYSFYLGESSTQPGQPVPQVRKKKK